MKLTVCLHTLHLGCVFNADILSRHHPCAGHLESMCCPIIYCSAGSRCTGMLPCGGMDACWKPGGSKMDEKSSLLSDNAAASLSEDNSTTAGYREATCMRRAYANSLQIGVASVIHPFKPFFNTWGWEFPFYTNGTW